ncbi:MAG: VacJ family lipoprotein [Alphaproteobacteria bacterium]|nr:VacJ family lipoprotein [Alphaproteobacteria bacterium]
MIKTSQYSTFIRIGFAALLLVAVAGCASAPKDPAARADYEKDNDPIEPFNRAMFAFNKQIDGMLLRPAAVVFREVLPEPVQDGVHNFLTNLRAPVVFANDVLQGEMDRAGNTAGRFVINTTVGVLGVWDAAAYMGIEGHTEDFGQTFAVWGVGEGFYLVLPFLGPSNPRDAVGVVAEFFLDPFNIIARNEDVEELILVRSVLTGVDFRARNLETIDELERTSLDYYVAVRSLYRQRRADAIRNGQADPEQPAPGITFQPGPSKSPADRKSARAE